MNAAKIIIPMSDLAERLGLPVGTVIMRIEIESENLEQVLAITVAGPERYPPYRHGMALQRIPLEKLVDDQNLPKPDPGTAEEGESCAEPQDERQRRAWRLAQRQLRKPGQRDAGGSLRLLPPRQRSPRQPRPRSPRWARRSRLTLRTSAPS